MDMQKIAGLAPDHPTQLGIELKLADSQIMCVGTGYLVCLHFKMMHT